MMRRSRLAVTLVTAVGLLMSPMMPSAMGAGPPGGAPLLDKPLNGKPAISAMGDQLSVAAERNGMSAQALTRLLDTDSSAWVDVGGKVFFVEPAPPPPERGAAAAPTVEGSASEASDVFSLHSRPGAQRVMYLDFDGHSLAGTQWDNGSAVFDGVQPGLDLDGSPTTWSSQESDIVRKVWRAVSEDFAPFGVDVTTQDPGYDAIARTTSSDTHFGTRVAMINSPEVADVTCGGMCGGQAYLDVFDVVEPSHSRYQPAIVYLQTMYNDAKYIAEVASHEAGHNLSLSHDGTTTGEAYYAGHGSWAPIMGGSYDHPTTEFSSGEYANANNKQDDLAAIAAAGAPLVADDHQNAPAASVAALPGAGVIGTRADKDVFRLDLACSGAVTVRAQPADAAPNLDIALRLLSGTGTVLAADDPVSQRVSYTTASGLAAAVTASLEKGTYYVEVDGAGALDPLTTGYSDYGSLGAYTVSATSSCQSVPSVPTSVVVAKDDAARSATISWAPPVSDGGSPVTGYRVSRDGSDAAGTGPWSTTVAASARSFTFTNLVSGSTYGLSVSAVNEVGTGPAGSGSVTLGGGGSRTVTLNPVADTMARQQSPTATSGGSTTLLSDAQQVSGSATRATSYLRFTVPALAAGESISGARLSVQVSNGTTNGPAVWRTSSSWSESTMSWNSGQPARSGTAAVGNFASMGTGRVSSPVSGVTAAGDVSFQLYADVTDGLAFAARESSAAGDRPQLVLTISTGG